MTPTPDATLAIQLQRPDGTWVDVGWLERRNQFNWFAFSDSYWRVGNRPVLGQVFEESGSRGKLRSSVTLPWWFSHLLPEGRLRAAVAEAAHVNAAREFELISRLGTSDLPGALRAITVEGRDNLPIPPSDESNSGDDNPLLKFSLAGAQLKFSVFGSSKGLTVPVAGQAGNYILKLPDGRPGFDGVPEAEAAGLRLAQVTGMRTPEFFLMDPTSIEGLERWTGKMSGTQALAVRRFDRVGEHQRVHMEELAQVLDTPTVNPNAKYDKASLELVAVFIGAISGIESVGEVIDRIVLNILLGNGDAHVKNWAFIYPDGRTPILSPLYDVLPTVLYIQDDNLGLNLRRSKIFAEITPEHFHGIGRRTSYGTAEAIDRAKIAVDRVMTHWPILKDHLSKENYSILERRLKSLAIVNWR